MTRTEREALSAALARLERDLATLLATLERLNGVTAS